MGATGVGVASTVGVVVPLVASVAASDIAIAWRRGAVGARLRAVVDALHRVTVTSSRVRPKERIMRGVYAPPRSRRSSPQMCGNQLVVTIGRPVPEVFAFTADMTNLPQWAAGQPSLGPRQAGTTYRITAKPPVGRLMHSSYVENQAFTGEGQFGPRPFSERSTDTADRAGHG